LELSSVAFVISGAPCARPREGAPTVRHKSELHTACRSPRPSRAYSQSVFARSTPQTRRRVVTDGTVSEAEEHCCTRKSGLLIGLPPGGTSAMGSRYKKCAPHQRARCPSSASIPQSVSPMSATALRRTRGNQGALAPFRDAASEVPAASGRASSPMRLGASTSRDERCGTSGRADERPACLFRKRNCAVERPDDVEDRRWLPEFFTACRPDALVVQPCGDLLERHVLFAIHAPKLFSQRFG
jgi:hypothetical protein